MSNGFGDFEPDDSFALGESDPEAVARILLLLVRRRTRHYRDFDHLPAKYQAIWIAVIVELLARLKREGVL